MHEGLVEKDVKSVQKACYEPRRLQPAAGRHYVRFQRDTEKSYGCEGFTAFCSK